MSREEVLARHPGARWREVDDHDRQWCAATGRPVPLGYVVVDATVRRVADGVERTVTSHGTMVEIDGDEALEEAIDVQMFWWTDGNGGCEANLELGFLRAAGNPIPECDDDDAHRCKHVNYRIVAPEWLADDP